MQLEVFLALFLDIGLGNDGGEGHTQVVQDGSIGLLAVDHNGIFTGDFHALNEVDDVGDIVGVDGAIQGVLHVLHGHFTAVMELHALTDGELPVLVVQLLIALGQQGLGVAVAQHHHQRGEHVAGNGNGGSLFAHMGIHGGDVRGLGPDDGILVGSVGSSGVVRLFGGAGAAGFRGLRIRGLGLALGAAARQRRQKHQNGQQKCKGFFHGSFSFFFVFMQRRANAVTPKSRPP